MDLHDYDDVAADYDYYLRVLAPGHDSEKVEFHLELARQYGQQGVADIACGTGAVLIPLIEAGCRVVGVDLSAAMLGVLRGKLEKLPRKVSSRTELICANMKDLRLEQPVSLAVIPGSGFMHLPTAEDQEEALRRINHCLMEEGVFSFNTFDPDYRLIADNAKGSQPESALRNTFLNARGNQVELWETTEFDPARQLIEGTWRFRELDEQGAVIDERERPLTMRWSFEAELRHLLRLCGFEVVELYSSYKKDPRQYGGWIVWVARKKA